MQTSGNYSNYISNIFEVQIHKDSVNHHRILKYPQFYGFLKNPSINFKDPLGFHKL